MQINFHHAVPLTLVDASLAPMGFDREPGLHQSDILNEMKRRTGEGYAGIAGEDPAIRAQIGFLWENALEQVIRGCPLETALQAEWKRYCGSVPLTLPEGVSRGAEVQKQLRLLFQGVHMTPDGYDVTVPCLEQYKLTWRTLRKWEEGTRDVALLEEEFGWWLKAEMNCLMALNMTHMTGLPDPGVTVRTVRFFIAWLNGDYTRKPGRGPQATITEIEFTTEELEANWRLVQRYRRFLEAPAA